MITFIIVAFVVWQISRAFIRDEPAADLKDCPYCLEKIAAGATRCRACGSELGGASHKGREELAEATGISPKSILEWVNHADLYRLKGVGSEFSDLLEAAGVDTVAELARRNAKNLAETFGELDMARNTVRRIPSEAVVQGWIDQAKDLPRIVEY